MLAHLKYLQKELEVTSMFNDRGYLDLQEYPLLQHRIQIALDIANLDMQAMELHNIDGSLVVCTRIYETNKADYQQLAFNQWNECYIVLPDTSKPNETTVLETPGVDDILNEL